MAILFLKIFQLALVQNIFLVHYQVRYRQEAIIKMQNLLLPILVLIIDAKFIIPIELFLKSKYYQLQIAFHGYF